MNTVITSYFNSFIDPQRDVVWEADSTKLEPLVKSLNGENLVILTDCLGEKPKHWKNVTQLNVKINHNPYFARWLAAYDYLSTNHSIDKVFLVDATDVEMLKNPFEMIEEDIIYVGDEKDKVSSEWIVEKHPHIGNVLKDSKLPLLNIGILGGSPRIIVPLLFDFKMMFLMYGERLGLTEMAVFNLLLHSKYKDVVKHGFPINSHFNKFETDSKAYWKHKAITILALPALTACSIVV